MLPESKVLMIGLRGSGKTTYLAALWNYLESAEMDDEVRVPKLQSDRDYLNAIRNNWLALKPVGRTSLRTTGAVSMNLEYTPTSSSVQLTLPDLSGEYYRLQWTKRKASESYVNFARECTGAFLFLHAADIRRTHAIKARSVDDGHDVGDETKPSLPTSKNWTPEQSSTQVQLVDILQLLLAFRNVEPGMRVAVIISAWDLIKVPVSPVGLLESRAPLLSQFLRANEDWISSEVFGVSSQGGDLTNDRERLLDAANASSRCSAVRGAGLECVSITEPLQFLLNVTQSDASI